LPASPEGDCQTLNYEGIPGPLGSVESSDNSRTGQPWNWTAQQQLYQASGVDRLRVKNPETGSAADNPSSNGQRWMFGCELSA
jgi:hypothetical protein